MAETDLYDYDLPRHLIAQNPLANRGDARLMVVDRADGSISHTHVRDLPQLLAPPDCLILNDSRVVPARLLGYRTNTGGHWEGLFLSADENGLWRVLGKARGRLQPGETITLVDMAVRDEFRLRLMAKEEGGVWLVRPEPLHPEPAADTWQLLDRVGRVPLPHYIRHGEMVEADRERYQTVYAKDPGSVAAPTAGLHFTPDLLTRIDRSGVAIGKVTLHVGVGTFRPIATDNLADHVMHSEWASLPQETADTIRTCRARGGRVLAVGTTSLRTLESAASQFPEGELSAWSGDTSLFIRPGYRFRVVDCLLTNFHLPRSTLLVLVRTFGGDELIRRAYEAAIQEEYHFFSYGDAMLIV